MYNQNMRHYIFPKSRKVFITYLGFLLQIDHSINKGGVQWEATTRNKFKQLYDRPTQYLIPQGETKHLEESPSYIPIILLSGEALIASILE